MNKKDLSTLVRTFAVPALVMVLGLILLLNPDTASIMLARLISWVLIAFGICFGLSALLGDPSSRGSRILGAAVGLIAGFWLNVRPLILAEGLGRFIGILLLIQGLRDLYPAMKHRARATLSSIITTAVGAILILIPMTTSRLIISLCGLVILGVGIAIAVDRFKGYKQLEEPGDPNIIDADE